ncbi:MAG: type II secretion system F family protein, partial [Clostridia bacterium]|nr:type II secretion system F family protein [Clostridia bacterium]
PSEDLELIVTAVLIQRQIGGNLAEVLDKISHTIRERIRIQGEIKTMTAQGKISGIIIGLMPPFLILVILMINYEYMMPLFNSTIGRILLMGSIVSEMIGVLIIRKVIAIDM